MTKQNLSTSTVRQMATTKINLPKQMIKDLGLNLSNQKIDMLERKISFLNKDLEDAQLQLAREYDRAKNGSKKKGLHFKGYIHKNLWRD